RRGRELLDRVVLLWPGAARVQRIRAGVLPRQGRRSAARRGAELRDGGRHDLHDGRPLQPARGRGLHGDRQSHHRSLRLRRHRARREGGEYGRAHPRRVGRAADARGQAPLVSVPDGLSAVAASAPSVYIANARLVRPGAGAEPRPGGVLVQGDSITAVALTDREQRETRSRAREVFDAAGMILMPGLVNAHYHSYGTLLKGTQNRLPLEPWALYTVAYGRALGAEAIRLAVMLGAAEMIRNGVTACLDHFPHTRWADVALSAHEASGMRVAFAPFMYDVFDHEFLQIALPPEIRAALETAPRSDGATAERMYRDLGSRWRDHRRVTIVLGPNAFQRCSPALLEVWRRLAADPGFHAHTHLVETRAQAVRGRAVWPDGTVAEMARAGLLGERLSVAHGVWLTPEEGDLLARHGV